MPELPEVFTITKDLNDHLKGSTITDVRIDADYNIFPDDDTFISSTKGKKIKKVSRLAKNIVFELNDVNVVFHLAMTGRLLLRSKEDNSDKWVKVVFYMSKGSKTYILTFTDMRTFGKAQIYNKKEIQELKNKYGPEPIDNSIKLDDFYKSIKSKRSNIKNVLLDQSRVSGLGNIYVTDTLFLAKIHPKTHTDNIDMNMAKSLWEAANTILSEGIEHRGSTLPDRMYVDIFGNEGSHQKYFRVYSKDNCPECETKIEYIKLNGRGTYYCPTCQKLPQ
jgi:formamidopyrimidine-DNA glycosylase